MNRERDQMEGLRFAMLQLTARSDSLDERPEIRLSLQYDLAYPRLYRKQAEI